VRSDGKTTAVHRNAITGVNRLRDPRGRNLQLCPALGRANPKHAADFLDKTSKHPARVGTSRPSVQTTSYIRDLVMPTTT